MITRLPKNSRVKPVPSLGDFGYHIIAYPGWARFSVVVIAPTVVERRHVAQPHSTLLRSRNVPMCSGSHWVPKSRSAVSPPAEPLKLMFVSTYSVFVAGSTTFVGPMRYFPMKSCQRLT